VYEENKSRTFHLDRQLVDAICSTDPSVQMSAIAALPEALSQEEIRDLGTQFFAYHKEPKIEIIEKRKVEFFTHMGIVALVKGDLVTAENTTVLILKEEHSIPSWLFMKFELKRAKRRIVRTMMGEDL